MTEYVDGESEFHRVVEFRLKFKECGAYDLQNYVLRNDIRSPLELKEKIAELIKTEKEFLSDDELIANEAIKIGGDDPKAFVVIQERHEDVLKKYTQWLEVTNDLFKD